MRHTIHKLTADDVKRANRRGYYGDGGGLYLQVSQSGSKNWVFRYRVDGRLREMGLGAADEGSRQGRGQGPGTVTLIDARDKAYELRKQRHEKEDPIETRRAEQSKKRLEAAKSMTFRQCAEAYITAHRVEWGVRHGKQWPQTLQDYVYPVFGALPVASIDVGLVMKAIEPIWTKKPETASRVRGRIESVLDWAATRNYRSGENPARWKGHLENLLPKKSKVRRVKRHAALPYAELPEFMARLGEVEGVAARALEFTILTAARTSEVRFARWDEINIADRLWIVPAARMKAGKEHRVPLSGSTIEILGMAGWRACLSWLERPPDEQRRYVPGARRDGAQGNGSRVSVDLLRLVRRANGVSERGSRNGTRAHALQRGRGGISARGSV